MTNQRAQKIPLITVLLLLACGCTFADDDPKLRSSEYYVIYGEITWDGTDTICFVETEVNRNSGEEFIDYGFVHLNEDLNMSLTIRYNKTKNAAKMILSSGKEYSEFPNDTVNVVYQFDDNTLVETQGKIKNGKSRDIEFLLSDKRLDSMISLMENSDQFVFWIVGEEFKLDIAGLNQGQTSILGGRASDDFKYLIGKIDADTLQENRRVNTDMSKDEWKEFQLAIQEDDTVIQFGGKRRLNVYGNLKIFESKPRVN
ncbi:MAG: hypothetical protein F4W92_08560 [Gammaproteobacteria bacterium]|nr:hypothetical protein [Gammaproteobacteria bacterium]